MSSKYSFKSWTRRYCQPNIYSHAQMVLPPPPRAHPIDRIKGYYPIILPPSLRYCIKPNQLHYPETKSIVALKRMINLFSLWFSWLLVNVRRHLLCTSCSQVFNDFFSFCIKKHSCFCRYILLQIID